MAQGFLPAVSVDVGLLRRSPDFRVLWLSGMATGIGGTVGYVALLVQIFDLTHSPTAVGLAGLAQFVAVFLGSVVGASVLDHFDRRTLLLVSQLGLGLGSLLLLAGALAGRPPIALVYLAAAIGAAFSSVHFPTRAAMLPGAIGAEPLATAMAVDLVMWNAAMIVGPITGGFVVGRVGVGAAYAVALAGYLVAFAVNLPIRPQPLEVAERPGVPGRRAIREGLAFLHGHRVLKATLAIDLAAMIFGMRRALYPLIAQQQMGRGPETVGVLFAAIPAGALIVLLTAGWIERVDRQGLAVICSVAAWGAAVVAFGLSGGHLALAVSFLAAAGGADIVSAIFRGTILQRSVPEELRGRLWGLNHLAVNGGPRLGDLEAGVAADLYGPVASVVSGGLLCLAAAATVGLMVPELARYSAGEAFAHPRAGGYARAFALAEEPPDPRRWGLRSRLRAR